MGEGRCPLRQSGGRSDRAHLLHVERAVEGRPAAEQPAADRSDCERVREQRTLAAADQARLRASAQRRGGLEANRPASQWGLTGAGDDLPSRDRLSTERRLRGLVRPHTHGARVLSGSLRAAERRRTRAGDGPEQSALPTAGDVQQRFHLPRREQRLHRQRPRQRATRKGQRHASRVPRRPGRDRALERRPQRRTGCRLVPPEPPPDHLERTPQSGAQRQLTVGLHARQLRPRLAHRRQGSTAAAT